MRGFWDLHVSGSVLLFFAFVSQAYSKKMERPIMNPMLLLYVHTITFGVWGHGYLYVSLYLLWVNHVSQGAKYKQRRTKVGEMTSPKVSTLKIQ